MNTMIYRGFKAKIMEADRLLGNNTHGLPPGRSLEIYNSEVFVNYPENWMVGPGVFVVPVRPNKGLWFDWRENDEFNTAILPTVKGCNPITGLQTSGFHLEKYEEKCPKHKCDFMAERFCPRCNYRWPPQNYISHPNILWWDTWVTGDGIGRQFFFTEEELRDVATHMIGKENTVPAFGFAFYTPKERREHPQVDNSRGVSLDCFPFPTFTLTSTLGGIPKGSMDKLVTSNNNNVHIYNTSFIHKDIKTENKTSDGFIGSGELAAASSDGGPVPCAGGPVSAAPCGGDAEDSGEEKTSGGGIIVPDSALYEAPKKIFKSSGRMKKRRFRGKTIKTSFEEKTRGLQVNSTPRPKPVKEVSIGTGAKIRQALNHDPYPLESWKEAPDASMTVYFVFQEKLEELKSKGMRNLEGDPEGMLKDIPVG